VYRATHFEKERSAAVKLVLLTEKTTDVERQTLEREMRIHQALKCANVIEFMDAVIVDNKGPQKITYVPGVYMLLELAGAGDLFDKIGAPCVRYLALELIFIAGLSSSGCGHRERHGSLLLCSVMSRCST
jgi:serine/threonine protein kinase